MQTFPKEDFESMHPAVIARMDLNQYAYYLERCKYFSITAKRTSERTPSSDSEEADVQDDANNGLFRDDETDPLFNDDAEGSPHYEPLHANTIDNGEEVEEPVYDSDDPDRPPTVDDMTSFTKEAFAALPEEVVKKMGRLPRSYYVAGCRGYGIVPRGIEKVNGVEMVWGEEKRFRGG